MVVNWEDPAADIIGDIRRVAGEVRRQSGASLLFLLCGRATEKLMLANRGVRAELDRTGDDLGRWLLEVCGVVLAVDPQSDGQFVRFMTSPPGEPMPPEVRALMLRCLAGSET